MTFEPHSAASFLDDLDSLRREHAPDDIPKRDIFGLAKQYMQMEPPEIERVLEDATHDARLGAVSVMDFQARQRSTSTKRRRELYELYLGRHDRIDTWDLVDRSAPYVVGGYLFDRDRQPLYRLARSDNKWERRTAIVATYYFIRQDDLIDTFAIAEILVNDVEDLVQKAVGSWVREAGKRDISRLQDFLDRHAGTMPRTTLRYAIEHLDGDARSYYLGLRGDARST